MSTQIEPTRLTEQQLISELHATFPGIWARPAAEYGRPEYPRGVWLSGDACVGQYPIFLEVSPDPDLYDGTVLQAFSIWLSGRGYETHHWDAGVYFAVESTA